MPTTAHGKPSPHRFPKGRLANPNAAANLLTTAPNARRWTHAETQAQLQSAEHFLATPLGTAAYTVRKLREQYPGMGRARAERLVRLVLDRLSAQRQGSKAVEDARSQAISRVLRQLHAASGRPNIVDDPARPGQKMLSPAKPWLEEPDHKACAQYELILMRLQGTDTPIKVDVEHRLAASMEGVIAGLSARQVERFVLRRRELERLADLARRRLPECVDAEGAAAEDDEEGDTRVSP